MQLNSTQIMNFEDHHFVLLASESRGGDRIRLYKNLLGVYQVTRCDFHSNVEVVIDNTFERDDAIRTFNGA